MENENIQGNNQGAGDDPLLSSKNEEALVKALKKVKIYPKEEGEDARYVICGSNPESLKNGAIQGVCSVCGNDIYFSRNSPVMPDKICGSCFFAKYGDKIEENEFGMSPKILEELKEKVSAKMDDDIKRFLE